jgi:hypothetical protein
MTTTFFVGAVVYLAMAMLLFRTNVQNSRLVAVSAILFVIAAIGITIAGIFPMDAEFPPTSFSGKMHGVGGIIGFPALGLAPLLATIGLKSLSHGVRVVALFLAAGAFACAPLLFLAIEMGAESPSMRIAGLVQRCQLLLLYAWMLWIGRQLATRNQSSAHGAP